MRKEPIERKSAERIKFKGRVDNRDEARKLIEGPGDAVLIVRQLPRSIVMGCPCGCGDQLTINLDARGGRAWRMATRGKRVTLYPSVWRESGCKSHFVIWQNHIYLFGENDFRRQRSPKLEGRVYGQFADGHSKHFVEIADVLGELPWSVLVACENLVSDGKLRELEGFDKGSFVREDGIAESTQ